MAAILIDVCFLIVLVGTAWFVASHLLVDSITIALAVLLSSLITMNTFEPLAFLCRRWLFLPTDVQVSKYLWIVAATGIFVLTFLILLQTFYRLTGESRQFGRLAESVGCWATGIFTGYLLGAFSLTIFQTIPGSRDYGGMLAPELEHRHTVVGRLAPDYQFLTLCEYVCVPRSPFVGESWEPRGPLFGVNARGGRWASFPVRYALWRESFDLAAESEANTEQVKGPNLPRPKRFRER